MELIRKKEFVAITLDLDDKIFIVYIVSLANPNIYLFCKSQIALLKTEETSTFILMEDADFTNIISFDLAAKFPEKIKINNYTIDLIDDK